MHLKDYLPENHILVDLHGQNKAEIIEELLQHMHNLGLVKNYDLALKDIMAREGYLSTGLEHGLAIPHAKTDSVENLSIVFGIKRDGIDFESLDAKPAYLIFLVLSPRDTSGPHIQALAMISRNLKNAEVREILKRAETEAKIAESIADFN